MDYAVLRGEKATLSPQTETQGAKQHQATLNSASQGSEKLARVRTERVPLRIHLLKHTKLGVSYSSVHASNSQDVPSLPST